MQRYRIDRMLENLDSMSWFALGQSVRIDNQGNGVVFGVINGHKHRFDGCTLSEILETLDELVVTLWKK